MSGRQSTERTPKRRWTSGMQRGSVSQSSMAIGRRSRHGGDHERRLVGAHALVDHSRDLRVAVLGHPVLAVAQRDHGAVSSHGGDRLLDHRLHDLAGSRASS